VWWQNVFKGEEKRDVLDIEARGGKDKALRFQQVIKFEPTPNHHIVNRALDHDSERALIGINVPFQAWQDANKEFASSIDLMRPIALQVTSVQPTTSLVCWLVFDI
jgi:hypothetical protein